MVKRMRFLLVGVAYASFVMMGLAAGLLGVAWPSMRTAFGLPLDAVGVFMFASMVGSMFSSFSGGLVASAIGIGPLLVISGFVQSAGLLGSGIAPVWWAMVLCGLLSGLGNGAMHAGLNIYFAANHDTGKLTWLHACFGLGATFGPILITALLGAGYSWRWGYGLAGATFVLLTICFALTAHRWRGTEEGAESDQRPQTRASATLQSPVVWLSLALFFAYTGVETTAGQWAYSLFTGARSVPESTAGLWVGIYWGALTLGRLILGGVSGRLRDSTLLRVSTICVIGGAALIWFHVTDLLSFLGLALMGLAEAPIFPVLVSDTSRRVGAMHANNTIGFQIAAASLGGVSLSGLTGVLAERIGLEVTGPFLLIAALILFALHEATMRTAKEPHVC